MFVYFHANQNHFHLSGWTHFKTVAEDNLEKAYSKSFIFRPEQQSRCSCSGDRSNQQARLT